LVPDYLKSDDEADQPNLMDYGFQLGRRFRALKLWMVINYYGVEGLQNRIREHLRLAQTFRQWVENHADFELMAPVELSVVCFRCNPSRRDLGPEELDGINESLLDAINRTGKAFLSHTTIGGRIALRCAIGNIRTDESHIVALENLLDDESSRLL
jgi:aromatic-L-amino-acid decarboxylase